MTDFTALGVKTFTARATPSMVSGAVLALVGKSPFTARPIFLYTQVGLILEAQNGYFLQDQKSPEGTPVTVSGVRNWVAR